jgi:hypothetical protein
MSASEIFAWASVIGIGSAVVALAIGYTFAPKRTRRTVNYILNTWREAKQAKEGKEGDTIEVPDFETRPFKKVPNPRIEKEPEL